MGIDCAERVARIFTLLLDHPDFAGLFSDIHAAMEALRKLESTAVATEWGDFDRIAIDEIQDLTAIEFALISSFHTQISTNQGRLVWLLLAGDEGQTVVPTDFSWGAMKSQLHASLNCLLPDVLIEEFKLESNLRCPHKITEVINRSAGLYRKFPRAARPANQTPGVEGQALQAQLLRIACIHVPFQHCPLVRRVHQSQNQCHSHHLFMPPHQQAVTQRSGRRAVCLKRVFGLPQVL